jgi:hypothetical protein
VLLGLFGLDVVFQPVLKLALLLFDVVRLLVRGVELIPDGLQQLLRIVGGFGQLPEMMFEIVDALPAPGERCAREADDINLVLKFRQQARLFLVRAPQLESLAEERRDEHV